jgi:hypothetical protein
MKGREGDGSKTRVKQIFAGKSVLTSGRSATLIGLKSSRFRFNMELVIFISNPPGKQYCHTFHLLHSTVLL